MKKIILAVLLLALTINISTAAAPQKPPTIKGMHYMTIPEGIFLQAILTSEVSTKSNNLYDPVRAIIPTNFYYVNTICIPQNSILDGSITEFAMPKKGRDGLFKIHFDKITFPNGRTGSFNADLWMDGTDLIGGKVSALDSLREVPFCPGGLSPGYILMKPTGEYRIGKHTTLCAGTEFLVKVNDGVKINFQE